MNNEVLNFFSKYIEQEIGIIYSEQNLYQLKNRLEEVIKTLNIPDVKTLYQDILSNSPRFKKQVLLDIATNNETSFFRDPRVFNAIGTVLSDLVEKTQKDNQELRIWSAATSTGQEPVSVAILMEELREALKTNIKYSILCSDISERVLNYAQNGKYSDLEVGRGLRSDLLTKYFSEENSKWKVDSKISQRMTFLKHNLKDPCSHLGKFHLVLCRNILIYQNVESKKEILSHLAHSIHSGGYLVLGAGESLMGLSDLFTQTIVEGAVFYRRK
ncbi:MAG: protein-glutamate O-methyltransferase CheR [Candidatus Caldatribacteriota bacterium]